VTAPSSLLHFASDDAFCKRIGKADTHTQSPRSIELAVRYLLIQPQTR
jgi:hypothetical protein